MLVDYLKLRWDWNRCPGVDTSRIAAWEQRTGHVIQELNLVTGEIVWCVKKRDKRSDTHTLTTTCNSYGLTVEGSPARASGETDNVFGSGDLRECGRIFYAHARRYMLENIGLAMPSLRQARILRVDGTQNYVLGSLSEVRQALAYLRQSEGGRLKVDARYGETVYWQLGSILRQGKAYAKGSHLRRQIKRREAEAPEWACNLADRLLRLELTLGRGWFERRRRATELAHYGAQLEAAGGWLASVPDRERYIGQRRALRNQWSVDLGAEHDAFFGALVGDVEVSMGNLSERVIAAAPTKGQGEAALRTWRVIQVCGTQEAAASMPRSTWHRHKAILFKAGLAWGDLAAGQVVPIRRRAITACPVDSWDELRRVA